MQAVSWVDVKDLSQTGWAAVLPTPAPDGVPEALQELLDHRAQQVGSTRRFRTLHYRPGETPTEFVQRHTAVAGPMNPKRLPYYLLLVGTPEEIPFGLQYGLATQYAVGRICFEKPADYAIYAASVVAAEGLAPARAPTASFFAAAHRGDDSTQASLKRLMRPLAQRFRARAKEFGWQVNEIFSAAATKRRLGNLLTAPPNLLFTAGHGLRSSNRTDQVLEIEGALVCSDWPGPSGWPQNEALQEDHYFAAKDLAPAADLTGALLIAFACSSAGTPAPTTEEPEGPEAAIAKLPQKLLSHPNGGALAFLGHLGTAWSCIFVGPQGQAHTDLFESSLVRLLQGQPIGAAREDFAARQSEITYTLADLLTSSPRMSPETEGRVAALQASFEDIRNYVILGDPAVRLSASQRSPR
ncbi:MAG: hypothetical protein GY719_05890 [bacterium]|nr:hypothetical protein [bacterium]